MRWEFSALLLSAACLFSCGRDEACEKPGEVIEAFFSYIESGDRAAAFKLLDGESRSALEKLAGDIEKKTGKTLEPYEFIVPGSIKNRKKVAGVKIESGEGKQPRVVVKIEGGGEETFPMAREGNCYRVHLDI
jgi:hypothetical protein